MIKVILLLVGVVFSGVLFYFLGLENSLWLLAFLVMISIITGSSILVYPKEGEVTAIDFGNSLHNMLMKIPTSRWTREGTVEVIPFTDDPTLENVVWKKSKYWGWLANLTWKYLRAYPIGIPGIFRVHGIVIVKKRLLDKPLSDSNKSLPDRWIEEEKDTFTILSLRQRFPRPVYAAGVELPKDAAMITIVGRALFEVTRPEVAIYRIGGSVMSLIELAVSQGIVSACKEKYLNRETGKKEQLSYKMFTGLDIGIQGDFVKNVLKAVNNGSATVPGLEERCGIRVIELYIPEWAADPDTAELVAAQRSYETALAKGKGTIQDATINAEAKIKEAEAERTRKDLEGQGDALALAARLEALKNAGVDPRDIGTILAREGFKGQFLLESGAVRVDSTVNLTGGANPTTNQP